MKINLFCITKYTNFVKLFVRYILSRDIANTAPS